MLKLVPDYDSTLGDIHEYLCLLLNYAITHYLGELDPGILPDLKTALARCRAEVLYDGNMNLNVTDTQLHFEAASVFAATIRYQEWDFDLMTSRFDTIVSQFELILESVQTASFYPTLGLIPPLFLTATKCRRADTRHRAVRLLHGLHRREHMWTSCIAATIARFVIQEEARLNAGESNAPNIRVTLTKLTIHSSSLLLGYNIVSRDDSARSLGSTSLTYSPTASLQSEQGAFSRSLEGAGYGGHMFLNSTIGCHCSIAND